MLPNFLHVGVPKSGSATLEKVFKDHPEIYVPRQKELNFFSNDATFEKGVHHYENTFFQEVKSETMVGDLSIDYSTGVAIKAAERIKSTLGENVKLILTLRNPVDRAFSQYRMARNKGQIDLLSFGDSINRAIDIKDKFTYEEVLRVQRSDHYSDKKIKDVWRFCYYIYPGMYSTILNNYLSFFKRENILMLFLDDFDDGLQEQADTVCEFLGVSKIKVDSQMIRNKSTTLKRPWVKRTANFFYAKKGIRRFLNEKISSEARNKIKRAVISSNYKPNTKNQKVDKQTAKLLQGFYLEEIYALEKIADRDLSHWCSKY